MKKLIEAIVRKLVVHQDDVVVTELVGTGNSMIDVVVHKDDVGKIIGKAGKTADSIRNIVYAMSYKENRKYNLNISEKK